MPSFPSNTWDTLRWTREQIHVGYTSDLHMCLAYALHMAFKTGGSDRLPSNDCHGLGSRRSSGVMESVRLPALDEGNEVTTSGSWRLFSA